MGNPYEFRELMKAAFGYSDKTPEQVLAEQKARNAKGDEPTSKRSGKKASISGTPQRSEIDKMKALLAGAKPRPVVIEE